MKSDLYVKLAEYTDSYGHFKYLFTSMNICLLKLYWTTGHEEKACKGWGGRRLNINVSAAYLYWHKHHALQYKLQVQRKKCTRNVILGSRDIRSYPPTAAETHIYTGEPVVVETNSVL